MSTAIETWAVVELMGHVRMAGKLTEEEHFGAKLGRLDIPSKKPCETCPAPGQVLTQVCPACQGARSVDCFRTQYFGGSSVYRITPCTEELARTIAAKTDVAPIHAWELPRLPAPGPIAEEDDFDDRD